MDYENLELPDDVSEVVETPEELSSEPISSVSEEVADQSTTDEPMRRDEPGYVKGRVEKAVNKTRTEMQAQFDQQIANIRAEYEAKFAPLMDRMLEMDAQDLVKSGQVKDIELAKELVRLRNGQPAQEPKAEQPRQANGQFAPKTDPATNAVVSMLEHQAETIKENLGIDVTVEFMNNPEINAQVKSGRMDFYDVARYMQAKKKVPPSPVRSPNNGTVVQNPNAFDNMTPEQFARLQKRLEEGARFGLK